MLSRVISDYSFTFQDEYRIHTNQVINITDAQLAIVDGIIRSYIHVNISNHGDTFSTGKYIYGRRKIYLSCSRHWCKQCSRKRCNTSKEQTL